MLHRPRAPCTAAVKLINNSNTQQHITCSVLLISLVTVYCVKRVGGVAVCGARGGFPHCHIRYTELHCSCYVRLYLCMMMTHHEK